MIGWGLGLWSTCSGVLLGLGLLVVLTTLDPIALVGGLAFGTLTIGVTVFTFLGDGMAAYGRSQVIGFEVSLWGAAVIGLFLLVGPWAVLLVGVALATSPLLWGWIGLVRDRIRPPSTASRSAVAVPHPRPPVELSSVDMSAFEVAILDLEGRDPELLTSAAPAHPNPLLQGLSLDELCGIWRRSCVELERGLPEQASLQLLALREACLEEFDRRSPGGVRAWLASGGPRSDPKTYLLGSENS